MSELDNLLDNELDDLADLPSFTPFHPGAHTCTATMEAKEIAGKPAVELTFTHKESAEIVPGSMDQDGQARIAPEVGDTCNTVFFLDNDIGQGKLKETLAIFSEALNLTGTLRERIEAVKDVEVMLINDIRIDKNTKREYLDVKELGVI